MMSTVDGGFDPFAILLDYEREAISHVAGVPEQFEAKGLWRGVGYRIGNQRWSSSLEDVVEILPMPALTPVPGAQPWVLGVANVRGTLLPVVDLKLFLTGERSVLTEKQRVLVVRQRGGNVAVTVDEIYGQRTFQDDHLTEPGALADGRSGHFLDRAYQFNSQVWGVFSLDRLTRTPEFRQAAA